MAFNDTTTVILLVNTGSNASQVCFYNNVPTAEDGEAPTDLAIVGREGSGFVTWEGQQITALFLNHLLFTTQIRGDAAAQPPNTQVGTGYHSPPFTPPAPGQPPVGYNVFNIFRDNDRVVYTDSKFGACVTIYYCTFVSLHLSFPYLHNILTPLNISPAKPLRKSRNSFRFRKPPT
jgi:hypothetical protein